MITEIEDVETAIHIMFGSIILKVDELDGSLRQFYEKLKIFIDKKGKQYDFTRFEIWEATGVGKTQQHYYINQLVRYQSAGKPEIRATKRFCQPGLSTSLWVKRCNEEI